MDCQDLFLLSGTQPAINMFWFFFLKALSILLQKLRPFGTVNITDHSSEFCVEPWLSLAQTDIKPETTNIRVLLLQGAASFGCCYYSSYSLLLRQMHMHRESADSLFWSTKGCNSKI